MRLYQMASKVQLLCDSDRIMRPSLEISPRSITHRRKRDSLGITTIYITEIMQF